MPVYTAVTHEDPGQPPPINGVRAVVADIEEKGERIISTSPAGSGAVLIFTEPKAKRTTGQKETR